MNLKRTRPTTEIDRAQEFINRATVDFRALRFDECISYCRDALLILEQQADHPRRALLIDTAYRRIAEAHDRTARFDDVDTTLQEWKANTLRQEGQVDILAMRGRILSRKGEYEEAMRVLDEGVSLAQACGYAAGMAALMRFRADLLWKRGELSQALSIGQQALAIYERLDDLDSRARTLNTVGVVHNLMNNFYQGIKCWLRALELLEKLGDQTGLAVVSSNLGEAYQKLYAMKTALFYHQRALDVLGPQYNTDLLRNLGVDLVAVGRVRDGLAYLNEVLTRARTIADHDNLLQALHSLAEACYDTGDVSRARELALELLTTAQPINAIRHIIRAELLLGYCAKSTGDHDTAQEFFHECFMQAQNTADKSMIWQTNAALADVLAESQPEAARTHLMIAAGILREIADSIEDEDLRAIFTNAAPVARVLQALG